MSARIRRSRTFAAAALLAAAGLAEARNYGRATSPHEVLVTAISPEGDEDLFVFQAGPGFKVSAKAKRAKGATLAPVLDLLAPDGTPVPGIVAKASASAASMSVVVPEGGLFALRLRGSSGTGACTVSWKLKPAKFLPVKGAALGAGTETEYAFSARGGALVSWKLSFKGDGAAEVVRILGPGDVEVPYDPTDEAYVTRTLSSEKVQNIPVPADRPGGTYRLVVSNDFFPAVVNLSIRTVLPKLPKTIVTLTPVEPVLLSADRAVGACGSPLAIEGQGLDEAPAGLFFGAEPATAVLVEGGSDLVPGDGTSVSCRAPAGQGNVDLVFEASDGQLAVLPGAFTFDPLPTITSFDPTQGPGQGGVNLTLTGTGFQAEGQSLYDVLIGGVPCEQVRVVDSVTITCITPAHVGGPKSVVLRDHCGQEVTAPGQFTYGSGLFITTVRPDSVPTFGGVPVVISGSNFASTDQVFLDGVLVATTPVAFGAAVVGHRIDGADLPAHAPGAVDVMVASQGGAQTVKPDGLAYFSFADITSATIPAASATDDWGGVTNAIMDGDGDGKAEWILVADPAKLSATRPGTRILVNNGSGAFVDGTATKIPAPTDTDDFGTNRLLVGRLNADTIPDIYLSIAGTGTAFDQDGDGTPDWNEARLLNTTDIDPWGRLLFPDASGVFASQKVTGDGRLLAINGQHFCNATWACAGVERPDICALFDADFRSMGGTMGDLDGDLDSDVVLVNSSSLATFTGLSPGGWVGCYYNKNYQYYSVKPYGWAMRILTSSSNGGLTDRTADLMDTPFSSEEDFRAVAAAVTDVNGDFLNDILLVHDQGLTKGGKQVSALRYLRQTNSGTSVKYKQVQGFFPVPSAAGDDDWRGHAVAAGDLNNDFYRDVVVSRDDAPVKAGSRSTRILLQDSATGTAADRTAEVLAPVLPPGDDGRARVVILRDFDRDGDVDLLLSGPSDPGSGGRRTRLFLNVDRDPATGLPVLLDASAILPDPLADPGNAVAVAVGDVTGDGHLDLVLTDTHQTGGTPVRRTRIWKQLR